MLMLILVIVSLVADAVVVVVFGPLSLLVPARIRKSSIRVRKWSDFAVAIIDFAVAFPITVCVSTAIPMTMNPTV